MNWHDIIGLLSTLALFAPVLIILIFRLLPYKNYQALFLYCFFAFVYNLMTENIVHVPALFARNYALVNNLLDVPTMLLFLLIFSTSKAQTTRMKLYLAAFVLFEIIVVSIYGLGFKSITIIIGPGLVLIFSLALYFFVSRVKQSFLHSKAIGKAIIASSICFAYGCFAFIYIMHYILRLPDLPNIFMIYYIVTIVYCTLLSIGMVMESKRKRKLEELLVTRKELKRFFEDEKKPVTSQEATGRLNLSQGFNSNTSFR